MAAVAHKHKLKELLIFVVIFLLGTFHFEIGLCIGVEKPTPDEVNQWAKQVDTDLMNLNKPFDFIYRAYKADPRSAVYDQSADITMAFKDINEQELVSDMAKTLSQILSRKMEALKKSVKAAEDAVKIYPWKNDLTDIKDVHYYNSKINQWPGITMVYSERFGKEVNFNTSSVHIPVEIYEGSNDILNGLNWTSALDEQFKKNYLNDPDILWQYFGSQSGFMRTYPATNWNIHDGVDLYDVRRQSWYTQGSSSPKDMMILIDTSGSTYGQSLQLMKNAVKSILNTLGENDFVNVVEFAEKAKFVSRCFNHTAFVQANFRNKKQLERDVDKLSALGQSDFSVAIRFAFEKFNEFARNETNDENSIGANCNKVIMLLTDGGTDNAEDVFQEYNWPNKTVRVFTYAVGPTPNPINAVRWMACANRGYFSQIPAMGAIRSRVQEYIPVLSRPQVIKNKKPFEWGNIYEDHLGLGMMTTVTLPVYNHSIGSSNQTILGVMGVDVTTAQLEAHTPFGKIGPNGYTFAINPNGYVVFHPNLKTIGEFMKEPPNIDLLELEVEGDTPNLVTLRTEMIQGKTNKMTLYSYYLSPDRTYVTYGHTTYAFIPITNTTFRLGISMPTYQKKYPFYTGNINLFDWSQKDVAVLISPLEYYYKGKSKLANQEGTLTDITNMLQKDSDLAKWDKQFLFHLYCDFKWVKSEKALLLTVQRSSPSIKSVFVMTTGGMTLVVPESEASYFMPMRDLWKSSLFTRALYATPCIMNADHIIAKRSNTSSPVYINIACSIAVKRFNKISQQTVVDKPAVSGIRINHDEVMRVVHESIRKKTEELNMETVRTVDIDFQGLMTCQNTGLECYLLDNGGFLVATSREDARQQVGRFFGLVDPALMGAMNGTVFGRMVQYDFQAACKKAEDIISSGFKSFTVPSLNLISEALTTGFWTSKVSWAFNSFNFFSWLFSPTIEVMAESAGGSGGGDKECVKVFQQYYVKESISTHLYYSGFQCENCTRNFTAVWLKRVSLLFVVADSPCEECDDLYPPVSQAPREISTHEEEEIICQLAQNPRNRAQAYGCYHSDPNEDQSECGCASLRASRISVLLALVFVVWRWTSSSVL